MEVAVASVWGRRPRAALHLAEQWQTTFNYHSMGVATLWHFCGWKKSHGWREFSASSDFLKWVVPGHLLEGLACNLIFAQTDHPLLEAKKNSFTSRTISLACLRKKVKQFREGKKVKLSPTKSRKRPTDNFFLLHSYCYTSVTNPGTGIIYFYTSALNYEC